MLAGDTLRLVWQSFTSNKSKTILSSLGIVIGVMAVVVMLSVGEGLYTGVSSEFGDMNVNVVHVIPGGSFGMGGERGSQKAAKLTDQDVDRLRGVVGVESVSPRRTAGTTIVFRDDERSVSLVGVLPSSERDLAESIGEGRFLLDSDQTGVVLGHDVAQEIFRMPINPGNHVTLENTARNTSNRYRVVGVLEEQNESSLFGANTNSQVYVTHQAMKDYLDMDEYTYSTIQVSVENTEDVEETANRIDESLKRLHRNEAYQVITQKSFLESLNQVLSMIKYALGGIGAISLLVGGIGIINVMMLTVAERVREIGVMKAVGATKSNIRILFLLESGILGLVSGAIGVTLGTGIAQAISTLGSFPVTVTWNAVLIGLGFGVLTTTIAGVYPAAKAARLDPVEALRSE